MLDYIHSIGIVHRDIKLQNLIAIVDPIHPDKFSLKLVGFEKSE